MVLGGVGVVLGGIGVVLGWDGGGVGVTEVEVVVIGVGGWCWRQPRDTINFFSFPFFLFSSFFCFIKNFFF